MQRFPFLFGASTSAHQIEGGNRNNDWWEWEKTRPVAFRSGKAADSWNRYPEDFALAKELGHTAHRLSLEWSRIEPQEGKFNQTAIQHYRKILEDLHSKGIKTFVTLHHFTNPIWVSRLGGWESRRTPELFNEYVKYVALHLGDLVDFWITINEPMVYASKSYMQGDWPPQKKSAWLMLRVMRNMARAHKMAYRTLHRATPHTPIGFAKHLVGSLSPAHDWFFNHLFFFLISNKQDFIGVNYYFPDVKSLTQVLLSLKKYKKPIYITENGLADESDAKRADFIRSHIRAIEKAQQQGCDVRGYFHWSLIDNFEWEKGFTPRFGLIAVNFETMERTIRPSAFVYKAIIQQSQGVVSYK